MSEKLERLEEMSYEELTKIVLDKSYSLKYRNECAQKAASMADDPGFKLDEPNWEEKVKARIRSSR